MYKYRIPTFILLIFFMVCSFVSASTAASEVKDIKIVRSEERRVGKECRIGCRSRWSPYH